MTREALLQVGRVYGLYGVYTCDESEPEIRLLDLVKIIVIETSHVLVESSLYESSYGDQERRWVSSGLFGFWYDEDVATAYKTGRPGELAREVQVRIDELKSWTTHQQEAHRHIVRLTALLQHIINCRY